MKQLLQKKLQEARKNKKGFTLIEIIVVLVILAIILAISVPAITGYIDEAKNAKYLAQARSAFIVSETERAKAEILEETFNPADEAVFDVIQKNSGLGENLKSVAYADGVYTIVIDTVTVEVTANDKMEIKK